MSLSNSPSIVTNGLVFAYDMYNPKSYRSPPLKNVLTQITPQGQGSSSTYQFSNGTENVYIPDLGFIPNCAYMDMYNDYNGGSGNCCPSPYTYGNGLTVSPATEYTYAIVYKSVNGYTHPNFMYHYEYTSGGSYLTEFGVFYSNGSYSGQVRSLGNDWYWASAKFTTNASAGYVNTGSWMYEYGRYNRFYVAKAMLVPGDYTNLHPRFWPALNTTVSNTQALIDLTNNNTNTINSLTYSNDGTFSFSGSNSITVPFNSSAFTFNAAQTIIIWMKNQSPSSARRNPYNQAYAGGGTITHENDTAFNYYYGTGGGDNSPYQGFTSSFSVVVGETAMICITRDASTVSWYKNGVFSNSTSNPYGSGVVTGTNNITIGSGYAGGFAGSIYAVQLYNRALTATEVAQNFNALRGRYGV